MIPTSEDEGDYNGPFSHTAEWHVALYGIAAGWLVAKSEKVRNEIPEQLHYFIGAALAMVAYLRFR